MTKTPKQCDSNVEQLSFTVIAQIGRCRGAISEVTKSQRKRPRQGRLQIFFKLYVQSLES